MNATKSILTQTQYADNVKKDQQSKAKDEGDGHTQRASNNEDLQENGVIQGEQSLNIGTGTKSTIEIISGENDHKLPTELNVTVRSSERERNKKTFKQMQIRLEKKKEVKSKTVKNKGLDEDIAYPNVLQDFKNPIK